MQIHCSQWRTRLLVYGGRGADVYYTVERDDFCGACLTVDWSWIWNTAKWSVTESKCGCLVCWRLIPNRLHSVGNSHSSLEDPQSWIQIITWEICCIRSTSPYPHLHYENNEETEGEGWKKKVNLLLFCYSSSVPVLPRSEHRIKAAT
jgi:hypothetical protein